MQLTKRRALRLPGAYNFKRSLLFAFIGSNFKVTVHVQQAVKLYYSQRGYDIITNLRYYHRQLMGGS